MGRFLDIHHKTCLSYEIDNFLVSNNFEKIVGSDDKTICFEYKYEQRGYNDYLVRISKTEIVIGYGGFSHIKKGGKIPFTNRVLSEPIEKKVLNDLSTFIKLLDRIYVHINLD